MKANYLIPVVIIIGVVTLFFFPEPEINFFAYLGTALFFIILVVFLIVWHRRMKK
jgi:asparagine N-glycosylation enzyme membrane subunit Stt3